jgi:hypothetical protein
MATERTTYLGTGIGNLEAAKRYLRRKFNQGLPEPVASRPGARFYVSMRRGRRSCLLLGPYVSHMTAQANVERGRRLAIDLSSGAAFCTFGTASTADTRPTMFGR